MGNHEFDYGQEILKKRMAQADFEWVCANVDMGTTGIPEPAEYKTIQIDDLKVTFLGLVETNGKQDGIIPSTHPGKVKDFVFKRFENITGSYANIKKQEDSDIFVALTHLGTGSDFRLAQDFPYFDVIIGGHSHAQINEKVNNIPVYQTRGKLRSLGKIKMTIENKEITKLDYTLIDLNAYLAFDADLKAVIDGYNDEMKATIDVKVGNSVISHSSSLLGCFYTDALTSRLNVDLSFQNTGGIRAGLDQGEITKREIYEMDPFNNSAYIYQMSVAEVKTFLIGSKSGFYYSGSQISQNGDKVEIRSSNGTLLTDNTMLSIGINDYIPAVNDAYFPSNPSIQPFTTADALIYYLENTKSQVNYPSCGQYFRYD
ncbi:MAG: 5'-nucleotidase/UDP-sugar diphosphatase [Arenicella sp.]